MKVASSVVLNQSCIFTLFSLIGYQCRKWQSTDISFILALGDNYESNVTFLMIASQYVYSAAAYNFGFSYRKPWFRNYLLVVLVFGFMFIHYWVTLVPGRMSCWLRINCVNEDNKSASVYSGGTVPIQNPYNTTLLPREFRIFLALLMTANLLAVLGWEFFIVGHGYGKKIWFGLLGLFCKYDEVPTETPVLHNGDSKSLGLKCDELNKSQEMTFEDP